MATELNFGIMCGVGAVLSGEAFPELYNISCNKEFSIANVMHFLNQRLHWDLLFSRAPQDWETEHFYTFLDLINSLPLNGEGQDKLCWKPRGNKNFKVSEFYLSLSSTRHFFPLETCVAFKGPS